MKQIEKCSLVEEEYLDYEEMEQVVEEQSPSPVKLGKLDSSSGSKQIDLTDPYVSNFDSNAGVNFIKKSFNDLDELFEHKSHQETIKVV